MIQSIFNFDNINFNGGNISCDGGSILLLSFLKKYNLLSSLDDIPFNDTRRLPKYSNSDIVTQIVLRNLLGYFNQADQMTLVDDPLLSQCINACSQPTLSRFFDRINMKTNMTIKEHIQRLGCDYVNRHVENIILDVDSTKTQTHGHQEASAYIYHYGVNGYHPMMINEYNTKLLLSSNFRTGAAYSSNGFINELKEVLAHLDRKGKTVSMICSGDAGVYGMAGLMYEVGVNYPETELEIIPGVTAATGGAAVLGAPLIHDFCLISLSDLLTPWEKIEARLLAAAQADFVVCLYNPSSKKRHDYLQKACDLMMKYKSPDTICGTVSNIARDGEEAHVMTLKELRDTQVDMFTTVFIGNSQTKEINNKMVTPRGYRNV